MERFQSQSISVYRPIHMYIIEFVSVRLGTRLAVKNCSFAWHILANRNRGLITTHVGILVAGSNDNDAVIEPRRRWYFLAMARAHRGLHMPCHRLVRLKNEMAEDIQSYAGNSKDFPQWSVHSIDLAKHTFRPHSRTNSMARNSESTREMGWMFWCSLVHSGTDTRLQRRSCACPNIIIFEKLNRSFDVSHHSLT